MAISEDWEIEKKKSAWKNKSSINQYKLKYPDQTGPVQSEYNKTLEKLESRSPFAKMLEFWGLAEMEKLKLNFFHSQSLNFQKHNSHKFLEM